LAATTAALLPKGRDGAFREDLYYLFNTVEIHLPPLRERRDDILPLAEHFLARHVERYRREEMRFSRRAVEKLQSYDWPGNVRQLEHCMERAVLRARGETIDAADLGLTSQRGLSGSLDDITLEEVEQALIRKELARAGGKVTEAAAALGLSRSALYRRLLKYGFVREESGVCS
jgi:DNA-binding NtrC family response regulator